jgi:hypothetical protein
VSVSTTSPAGAREKAVSALKPSPTTEVVALRNIRWVNAQGVVVVAGKLQRCHLPVKLADEALRAGMVAHVGDARIRHQIGSGISRWSIEGRHSLAR